jgi:ABC-type Zn uptake system ZnuABC Zn-binding protein ZnuA
MRKRSLFLAAALVLGSILMTVAYAQRPETDIDPHRHSNLAEAQRHVVEAYNKTVEAQKSNKDELGGHAERAIDLLDQANHELKLAAEYADHHRR